MKKGKEILGLELSRDYLKRRVQWITEFIGTRGSEVRWRPWKKLFRFWKR
jgi:hypothetical protein